MKRLITIAATTTLATATLGCAWLFDTGEYEARPQTGGPAGLPDADANDEYLEDQSNR
jgi:hypothetical protein